MSVCVSAARDGTFHADLCSETHSLLSVVVPFGWSVETTARQQTMAEECLYNLVRGVL